MNRRLGLPATDGAETAADLARPLGPQPAALTTEVRRHGRLSGATQACPPCLPVCPARPSALISVGPPGRRPPSHPPYWIRLLCSALCHSPLLDRPSYACRTLRRRVRSLHRPSSSRVSHQHPLSTAHLDDSRPLGPFCEPWPTSAHCCIRQHSFQLLSSTATIPFDHPPLPLIRFLISFTSHVEKVPRLSFSFAALPRIVDK